MSTGQRIIKSLAVAFGLFLTFTIFFSIVGGLYAFTSMFSKDNVIEEIEYIDDLKKELDS